MTVHTQHEWLLACFKALADQHRLALITRLAAGELNVTQIAQMLDLSEATVSHHLAKLREVGLVSLRSSGNQRFYRLNEQTLANFKQAVGRLETLTVPLKLESDTAWIDALPPEFSADERAYLRAITFSGRLTSLPPQRKRGKILTVLRWLASKFTLDVRYTESEVNAILLTVHDDYASLRRDLIDYGYLRRERGGGSYWRTPDDEAPHDGV